jgi:hypothetical protein
VRREIMKKITKLFTNIRTEENWLALQKGWKLTYTNGIRYTFEESSCEYNYEYVYFDKSKKELEDIRKQIIDSDIEFVCNSSSWALFRKDAAKGKIHVYADNYLKYKILIKKYKSAMALGVCYMCLGSSQISLSSAVNRIFGLSSALFYLSSFMFFMSASSFKKYSLEYDDCSYADRMKKGK